MRSIGKKVDNMYEVSVTANAEAMEPDSKEPYMGSASIVFDGKIRVNGLSIMARKDGEALYVRMPQYKSNEKDEQGHAIYKSICSPRTKAFAEEFTASILRAYIRSVNDGKMATDKVENTAYELDARVTPYERKNSNMLGIGTLNIGEDFKINNIMISKGKNFDYVNMPSYKTKDANEKGENTYKNYAYPITAEARKDIINIVTEAYHETRNREPVTQGKSR
jgi:DNA-binding cell septation regulator SpoVG